MVITLDREDVCRLMMACTLVHEIIFDDDPEWIMLHDKLKRLLEEYDQQRLREGDHSVR